MKQKFAYLLLLTCLCCLPFRTTIAADPQLAIEIHSDKFQNLFVQTPDLPPRLYELGYHRQIRPTYDPQHKPYWCWAASISMVLNHLGVNVAQEEVVARTYGWGVNGDPPNLTANPQQITNNLNSWIGNSYRVNSTWISGSPTIEILMRELQNNRPIIIAYDRHAVLLTGINYNVNPGGISINQVVVRDPWPTPLTIANQGRIVYAGQFINRVHNYWLTSLL